MLRYSLLLLLAGLALIQTCWASTIDTTLESQRQRFIEAWYLARDGEITRAMRLSKGLEDYPLYADLIAERIAFRPRQATLSEAVEFITAQSGSTAANRVVLMWQSRALRYHKWEWYEKLGNPSTMPVAERCLYVKSKLRTEPTSETYREMALDLWLYGRSRPSQCDKLFDLMRKTQMLTGREYWRRFELALSKGQYRLASYLIRDLPPHHQALGEQLISLRKRPENLANATFSAENNTDLMVVIPHILRRWARDDADQALNFWRQQRQHLDWGAELIRAVDEALAKSLYIEQHPQSANWIANIDPLGSDQQLLEWRLLSSLRHQHWSDFLAALQLLPPNKANSDRWRYWRTRALTTIGLDDGTDSFTQLAQQRSYYGYLAAERLGLPYRLNADENTVAPALLQSVANHPSVQRLREWLALGVRFKADLQWYFVSQTLTPQELLALAQLFVQWGHPEFGIKAAVAGEQWDNLDLRFPLLYRSLIDESAAKTTLDSAWLYGIARQESAFDANAKSPAGARGLLQLMPTTAKAVARKIGLSIKTDDLLNPVTNIQLGSHYLQQLVEQFDGNPALATAAYNAGPHRVSRWLDKNPSCFPTDIWVESIPYPETRQYVQNVLTYRSIYSLRMEQPRAILIGSETVIGATRSTTGSI